LIDNALSIPANVQERENLDAFLRELGQDIELLKKSQADQAEAIRSPQTSILPEVLSGVRIARDPRKLPYYRNLLWNYEVFWNRDYSKPLELFPEHFLTMLRTYSSAHLDTLECLGEIFEGGESILVRGGELPGIFAHLKIPGGCFMKVLLDFERDCLIDIAFVENERRYDLLRVKWIAQTGLWDDFFLTVISPPWSGAG
jgi:hypothetical protein